MRQEGSPGEKSINASRGPLDGHAADSIESDTDRVVRQARLAVWPSPAERGAEKG